MAEIEVFYPGVLKKVVLTIACRRWGIEKEIINKKNILEVWFDLIWLHASRTAQPGLIKS